ncbi:pimeloyl-ACP methyl ester carboxylesterase [Kribbella sp. VKM Ac-2527]|uniref:Pimeloyl-ACP methyl ester carboxylesterase n=1 Tax=Kribbella caucasensis TaxID=2512215 RepID=A0A4R6JKM1_9ACTN|nr:alpha/beta fold hydrolase [Kribbella sp. VKM Ac-2527]TDO36297.1 pimeloyl-ACP methyl ester carboxylesterase [Kribbella sp. VKM Ac-2527]
MTVDEVLAAHRGAGREFTAAGEASFVLDQGPSGGEAVVCLHGVPTSSFLYRGVLHELALRGLRGIAFDLPGLGLAARPDDFDYSWTGLGSWATAALDALGLDRVHLVVHDIGGPVGFEIAAAVPDRIRSILLLNTIVAVDTFRRPWVMEPFAHRLLGEAWLASARVPIVFRALMRTIGVGPDVPAEDLDAHLRLLLGEDSGRAFLRIMRSFERTVEKRRLYEGALRSGAYPVGLLWGSKDPALPLRSYGVQARLAARLDDIPTVPGKHFLQEDFPAEIAAAVAKLAR